MENFPGQDSNARAAHEGERQPLAVIEMTEKERDIFDVITEHYGMQGLFYNPQILLTSLRQRMPELSEKINEGEKSFLDKIAQFTARAGISNDSQLTFRYVSAVDGEELKAVMASGEVSGGQNPADSKVGICVDNGHKIRKYLKMERQKKVVVFVYDATKLTVLSPEERELDIQFAGGYGRKPRPGKTLRDALLGEIVFSG